MGDTVLPYTPLSVTWGDHDAWMVAMYRGLRLYIQVHVKDLTEPGGDQNVRQQFSSLIKSVDDDADGEQKLQDWMMLPCTTHVRQVSDSAPPRVHSTLQSYFHPETLVFTLMVSNKRLEARFDPSNSALTQRLLPAIPKSEEYVRSAIAVGVPCIAASQLIILREPGSAEWKHDLFPTIVQRRGTQERYHYKAASNETAFQRELTMLVRIQNIEGSERLHTSRLAGLVQWDDSSSIGGLLIEHIPSCRTLDQAAENASRKDRSGWGQEVRRVVEQLHRHGIVWGDVKPDNVLVDAVGQAWVIDFDGGFTEEWVDEELEGSKEGDLQGLARLDDYLASL